MIQTSSLEAVNVAFIENKNYLVRKINPIPILLIIFLKNGYSRPEQ